MQNLTRRSVAAGLVAGAAATVAIPAASAPAEAVDRLWRAYVALIPEARRLTAAEAEAERRMPFWARRGPAYIAGDGSYAGDAVGWPLDLAVQPGRRSPSHWVLCRPGPSDVQEAFDVAVQMHPESRDWARANYRRHMRALVERLRAQKAERSRVGLPTIEAAYQANFDQRFDLIHQIEAMPPCPDSTAALILHGAMFMKNGSAVDNLPGLHVLTHLRSHVSGLVKEHVEQLLETAAFTPVDRLPYYV